MIVRWMRRVALHGLLGTLAVTLAPAVDAAPLAQMPVRLDASAPVATPVQFSVQFGYGRPYRPYYYDGPRYGYYGGPAYRPYGYYYRPYGYYYRPAPPVTYYETRPYVVAPPPPVVHHGDGDAVARCASRFKSFNVNTGTYITYEGEERVCPYLR